MTSPNIAMASNLRPVDREVLDLQQAVPIKRPKRVADNLITSEEAAAMKLRSAQAPAPTAEPVQLPPQTAGQANQPILQSPAAPVQAIPAQASLPPDGGRASDRINKLYGQVKSRDDEIAGLRQQISDLATRLQPQGYAAPPQPAQSYMNQPSSFEPAQAPSPDAGSFVSRQELTRILSDVTRAQAEQNALYQAHSVSRREAELDFPDVFADSDLRDSANRIWEQDPYLKRDPMGPYKAAALARGLGGRGSGVQGGNQQSSALQKGMLSGIGPSVPEGQGQVDDRFSRYEDAKKRASQAEDRVEQDYWLGQMRRIQSGADQE